MNKKVNSNLAAFIWGHTTFIKSICIKFLIVGMYFDVELILMMLFRRNGCILPNIPQLYYVSSNAFVLKLCGFDPSVVLHTPYIIHCGYYVVMLVLWIAVVETDDYRYVVVVVVDYVDDDGEDYDNDGVEWSLLCVFFPCQGNQLDKPRIFWLTAHKYIHAVFV